MTDTESSFAGDPGWRPDPTGRFAERRFDGRRWTGRVRNAPGEHLPDDPLDAPTPPPKKKSKLVYGLAAIAVLLLGATAVLASAMGDDERDNVNPPLSTHALEDESTDTSHTSTTTEAKAVTTTTPTTAPTTAAAPTTIPAPTTTLAQSQTVRQWYDQHGPLLADIRSALEETSQASQVSRVSEVSQEGVARRIPGLGRACDNIRVVVARARFLLPIPAESLNVSWRLALDNLYLGSGICVTADRTMDAELREHAAELVNLGTHDLLEVTKALSKELTGPGPVILPFF